MKIDFNAIEHWNREGFLRLFERSHEWTFCLTCGVEHETVKEAVECCANIEE